MMLSKNKTLAQIWPLLTAVGLTAVISFLWYSSYQAHLRLLNGVQTEAMVANEYTKRRGSTTVKVKYSFEVNNVTYSGEANTQAYPDSRRLAVVYDPSDPNNNKAVGAEDPYERLQNLFLISFLIGVAATFALGGKILTRIVGRKPRNSVSEPSTGPHDSGLGQTSPSNDAALEIPSGNILWIEREIRAFNREVYGSDRPEKNSEFLQKFPTALLSHDVVGIQDVEEATRDLIFQTKSRLERGSGRKWEVPFRRPHAEFSSLLPTSEPGHIEFGNDRTVIRIHPKYRDDPFALAAILCHEVAHFVLDHNGLRKGNNLENERLTDLFVFHCGQGLIYLQGVVDFIDEDGQSGESKLGYLTLDEMSYTHSRCSIQNGLGETLVLPAHYKGWGFKRVPAALNFLRLKDSSIAEIVLCPNSHLLRISRNRKSSSIRCPKCGWEREIWLSRSEQLDFLISEGTALFDSNNFSVALLRFREAQQVDANKSTAFCGAAKSLKRLGKHQEAIREIKKFLDRHPNDEMAVAEMKKLIY